MANPELSDGNNHFEQIEALKAQLNNNPDDLVIKITLASALERIGHIDEAKQIYQEIVAGDRQGMLGASAAKALESMAGSGERGAESRGAEEQRGPEAGCRGNALCLPRRRGEGAYFQWFYNLPIARKQLIALILAEAVTIGALGVGAVLLLQGLRSQILKQSRAELEVLQMSYNTKINQMGFGFRGKASNPLIIEALKQKYSSKKVYSLLWSELSMRKLEFATLVDAKAHVIVNTGIPRRGSKFDPDLLVTKAIASRQQIKASKLISYDELASESPRFAELRALDANVNPATKPNFLILYVITPIEAENGEILGAIVAGDLLKNSTVGHTNQAFEDGYSAIYLSEPNGQFRLASSQEYSDTEGIINHLPLPNTDILTKAVEAKGKSVNQWLKLKSTGYGMTAKAIFNHDNQPTAVLVRGTCLNELNHLLWKIVVIQSIVFALAVAIAIIFAELFSKALVKPIHHLRDSTFKFAEGEREIRAEVFANDEIGELVTTFNAMADSINAAEADKEIQFRQRQLEAELQGQDQEKLQQSISQLLTEILQTQQGNLTVRVSIEEGEIGSIADAFNETIENLRTVVMQVQKASASVQNSACNNEESVKKLSHLSSEQTEAISKTLYAVREMGQSIYLVADSAQEAVDLASNALEATNKGEKMMSNTVNSIENIRASVAETSKKIKRLAESSQEISKIVNIITGISEKTNLLAFNASIEASRAGEHGHGFRVVADEVRRLAERVTESAKDIEQIVGAIQADTSEVMQTMENSTNQVVVGTKLVGKTKQTLQQLAQLTQQIDILLRSISTSTVSQTEFSHTVTKTMEDVAEISKSTSTESQIVFNSLQELVEVANELQNSISQFQVEGEQGSRGEGAFKGRFLIK
jgi:twitching motility protein PilJ